MSYDNNQTIDNNTVFNIQLPVNHIGPCGHTGHTFH